jgi:hypothetical protein
MQAHTSAQLLGAFSRIITSFNKFLRVPMHTKNNYMYSTKAIIPLMSKMGNMARSAGSIEDMAVPRS